MSALDHSPPSLTPFREALDQLLPELEAIPEAEVLGINIDLPRAVTIAPGQGDSELCGTPIECSLTGTFQLILHKAAALKGTPLQALNYPSLETQSDFLVHGFSYPNYLGARAQSEIYGKSSVDLALRDAFRKMRHFLVTTQSLSRTRPSR